MGMGTKSLFHRLRYVIRFVCTKFQVRRGLGVEMAASRLSLAELLVFKLPESQSRLNSTIFTFING